MRNTKWMVLCLFLGFLLAAGMLSTVPIYMDASLQRMLIKDMEEYQLNTGIFPGVYSVEREIPISVSTSEQLELINNIQLTVKEHAEGTGIPVSTSKTILRDNLQYIIHGANASSGSKSTRVKIDALTDFEDNVTITNGRMYCEGGVAEDGVYEVVATETALKTLEIVMGNEYEVVSVDTSREPIKMRIVGIYEVNDNNPTYWSEGVGSYINSLITSTDCFCGPLMQSGSVSLTEISVRYCLSYQTMDMNTLESVTAHIAEDSKYFKELGYTFTMNIYDTLLEYTEEAAKLTSILWILQIPTMIMLGFYLFMVSQLNVEQEKNEIAVFKSRGASSKQIFSLYAMEAGLLGLITLVAAPFIGLILCQFLGVSNGFLEFVNRVGIAAKITPMAILYSLLAVVIFFATTMLPIIPASKLSIVQYKQSKTKVVKMSLWEKLCADVILIAASVVFYIIYTDSFNAEILNGTFEATGEINPLFFIFSTCLVIGLGLLFIRIYPYILRLIYLIGKPFWSPSQYMALTTVSRSQGGKERFLMMFLVVTFSFGLFSANTARAINNNKSDRIYYSNGADITLKEYWAETTTTDENSAEISYIEKDFERFENLAGVETATKVLMIEDGVKFNADGKDDSNLTVMAIEPSRFAKVAWFRNDLLPIHWWNYCNALLDFRSGVIISTSLAEKHDVGLGDEVTFKWGGNDTISTTVLAVVDYWPGINPNATDKKGETTGFAVMNYSFVFSQTVLEPYEVWLDLAEGATSEQLYADIKEKKISVETITDSSQLLIAEKNEPQLQGMNGALTLSFVVIMFTTIIGFLIYWILSIKSRTLQFGILRAMGMTFREIVGILGWEQLLVSGVSIAAAFIIGGIASDLFVPLFQSMYNVVDQIPPFRVAATQADYLKIYALIVLMLGGGFAILGGIIKKININKALKLGED